MRADVLDHAVELLAKANSDLEPELVTAAQARKLLAAYARAEKLAAFGVAALSRKLDDAGEVARTTGTSVGKAKAVVATGKAMADSGELTAALQQGDISLDQAALVASAESSAPGSAAELIGVARDHGLHVLRDEARRVKLEAEQHRDLAGRQRAARFGRSRRDELGMVHIHLALEPHVGAPIVARAEAEAARIATRAKQATKATGTAATGTDGTGPGAGREPFERYLADAYARMLGGDIPGAGGRGDRSGSGSGAVKGRARRPELVVVVSHEVATRGWTHVEPGEVCKIPGVGPVEPRVARRLAEDAFITGVICDGKDLRRLRRWSRTIPVEVALALELGDPPHFDGIKCVDCGNRFRTEFDHVEPRVAGGPCSNQNLKPRCWSCHRAKTERDRRAGKLRAPPHTRSA
jgi:hypothetical protein